MTTITPGQTSILIFEAQQYAPNGPPVDVTGLTFALTRTDGTVLVATTGSGITHVGTGTYTYPYAAPVGLAAGQAFATWSSGQGSATELVDIGNALSSATGQTACQPWPYICASFSAASAAITGSALQIASDILYKLSGQQFGICTFTARPCRRDCYGNSWPFDGGNWWQWGGMWPRPVLFDGAWYNITCGSCSGTCSCGPLEEAWLPGPVNSIVQVKIDGQLLSPSAYRVDDFRKLVRTDGQRWPVCQNLTADDSQPGTWSVTAAIGQAVPELGALAVGELMRDIVAGCPTGNCALPSNATTISRQGLVIDLVTYQEMLQHGLLGLRWCDTFISTYNPNRLQAAPQVYDVDGESWRRTGTA